MSNFEVKTNTLAEQLGAENYLVKNKKQWKS
jgi:hypothetical protein